MNHRKILIPSEEEWMRVTRILELNHLPYIDLKKTDSAFPNVTMRDRFEITINEEDYRQFLTLTGGDYQTQEIANDNKNGKRRTWILPVLAIYAIVVTGMFLKYYHLNSRNSEDKNLEYTWSTTNQVMTTTRKSDGSMVSQYHDQNFDANFEKIEAFYDGWLLGVFEDGDENGVVNAMKYYDRTGKLRSVWADEDQDGRMERVFIVLQSGDTIKLEDTDLDGAYELK